MTRPTLQERTKHARKAYRTCLRVRLAIAASILSTLLAFGLLAVLEILEDRQP